jgi:hypothetical protein
VAPVQEPGQAREAPSGQGLHTNVIGGNVKRDEIALLGHAKNRKEFTYTGLTGSVDALKLRNTEVGRQSGQHSL